MTVFNPLHWAYDIETYPNIFTACFIHPATDTMKQFEISDRCDDRNDLIAFVLYLQAIKAKGVGFNNEGFDYPVIHHTVKGADPYTEAMKIINSDDRWGATIWDKLLDQIDLYKINHFDNQAKRTSLKDLEIVMRSETVQDLPFPPGTILTHEQMDELHRYNEKDVRETVAFLAHNMKAIEFREQLTKDYGRDFTNFADTKIGAEIFITELERAGVQCYTRDSQNKRKPRQTWRSGIHVNEIIFPYVKFERPEFKHVLDRLKQEVIHDTRKGFEALHAVVNGFQFDYGMGGIHGSVSSSIVRSDDEFVIYDWDVASYYPNLAIKNKVFPEHLGVEFCSIYENLYIKRANTPKSDPINGALKLALNGTYGNSNNEYSVFYDPKYTMTITINGQLLLSMLAEQLLKIPQLTMVQANTDGITVRCPRGYVDHMKTVCAWWENLTQLTLESVEYSMMAVRDVNNYIAVKMDGSVKRKGAYEYQLEWHKNPSMLAVKKAVEAHLVHGVDVVAHLLGNRDPYDFMIRAKVQRNCQLFFGERQTQRITRYFVANKGDTITKVTPTKGVKGAWKKANGVSETDYATHINKSLEEMYNLEVAGCVEFLSENNRRIDGKIVQLDSYGVPHNPDIHVKNKSTYQDSVTRFEAGWECVECADVADFDWDNLNYTYYIEEAMKLIEVLK